MSTRENQVDDLEGRELLQRLFQIAIDRLQERRITLQYTPSAIEWFLANPDWHVSLNRLRSLDALWHQKVANAIEDLLLSYRLKGGDTLQVTVSNALESRELRILVNSATQ